MTANTHKEEQPMPSQRVTIKFSDDGAGGWEAISDDIAYTAGGADLGDLADRIMREFPGVFPGAVLDVAFIDCTFGTKHVPGFISWTVPRAEVDRAGVTG